MFSYLCCLSRMVISAPLSSSTWQMCGWHIWVASTRGVLPSWRWIQSKKFFDFSHLKSKSVPEYKELSFKVIRSRCSEYLCVLLTLTIRAVNDQADKYAILQWWLDTWKMKIISSKRPFYTLREMKWKINSHKITGIHRSPAVTEKFHAGWAACHDCEEKR